MSTQKSNLPRGTFHRIFFYQVRHKTRQRERVTSPPFPVRGKSRLSAQGQMIVTTWHLGTAIRARMEARGLMVSLIRASGLFPSHLAFPPRPYGTPPLQRLALRTRHNASTQGRTTWVGTGNRIPASVSDSSALLRTSNADLDSGGPRGGPGGGFPGMGVPKPEFPYFHLPRRSHGG